MCSQISNYQFLQAKAYLLVNPIQLLYVVALGIFFEQIKMVTNLVGENNYKFTVPTIRQGLKGVTNPHCEAHDRAKDTY